ncbi:MAG: Helix-turn-helix domain protein [Deltaproteobacteria bacterium ADurb.Bin072]|nr:MAG: Helix-turn-helix domain protein [Deltaproteobacteria bacterium ADurb.Bin072]
MVHQGRVVYLDPVREITCVMYPERVHIVPDMSTLSTEDILSTTLFGKTRRAVLSLLFTHPDESFYLRQIKRVAGSGMGSVQRELKALTEAGIIRGTTRGNLTYYQANPDCPVYAELKGLIVKTAGIGDILRAALAPLSERLQAAFIHGSFARGREHKGSDVDLCVIGSVQFAEVVSAVNTAQQSLGREINPTVYPPEEFHARVATKDHFVSALMKGPKIFLVGDVHELARLAQ